MNATRNRARGFGPRQGQQQSFTLTPYTLRNHPWVDPDPECGVMPGAADGWCIPDRGLAVLFHTTTASAAAAILRDGFKASASGVVGGHPFAGIPGRPMPGGIWTSIRPTVPHDSDTWLPSVSEHTWAVLQVLTPLQVLPERCIAEHTWPVVQFCLEPADVLGVCTLPPSQMPLLIHPKTVRRLASFRDEHHGESPYLDAIDAAAAISKAGEVAHD